MADIDITVALNDRASQQLRNLDRAAKGVTNTLRLAAGAAAAFATGAVVQGIVGQYRAFERYRTVLTTFLGSQEKANKELARLQELANNLPQDLSDITEAFTIFSRFGLDTSAEALTAFSNIATGSGKSFAQLGEAVADALTGEFERLKEFGIKVARENDQFVARIGEDQVAIATSSQQLVQQLQALGEEGGMFGGAAAANADTLNQSISNLSGAFFEASVNIGEELRPALKGAIEDMTDLIRQNEDLQKSIGVGLGEAIKVTASGISILADNIELVRNAALAFIAVRFAGSFTNLVVRMSSAVKASQSLAGMLGTIGRVALKVITPLRIIGAVVLAAVAAFHFFQDTMVNVGDTTASLGEVVKALGGIIGDAFGSAFSFVSEVVNSAITNVKNIIVAIPGVVVDVGNRIMSGFNDAFVFVRELVFNAITSVRSFIAESSSPVAETMRRVGQGFVDGFNFVVNTVIASFTQIKNIVQQLPNFFIGAFKGVVSVAEGFGQSIVKKFGQIFEAMELLADFEFKKAFAKVGEETGFSFSESFKKGFEDSGISLIDTSDIFDVDRVGQVGDAIKDTYGSAAAFVTGTALPALVELKDMTIEQAEVLLNDVKGAYDVVIGAIEERVVANRAELEAVKTLEEEYIEASGVLEDFTVAQNKVNDSVNDGAKATTNAAIKLQGYAKFLNDTVQGARSNVEQTNFAMRAQNDLNAMFRRGEITGAEYTESLKRIERILGIVRDKTEKVKEATKESNKEIEKTTKTTADILEERLNGLSGSISNTLTDVFLGLKDGFEGLQDIALSVVKTIVNTLTQEFLVKPLLKNISSAIAGSFAGGGGAGGGIGSLFGLLGGGASLGGFGLLAGAGMLLGGLFANGGNVASGRKPIVVGERGPELFMPGRSGQVLSNETIRGMDSGGDQVNVNFTINAIDTQTGTEFLIQNKRVITGVVQEAFNRRATAGPLG